MRRLILAFGAGNIGLSFVGQIFSRSGYEVVFADTDSTVCEQLNTHGGYDVTLLDPRGRSETLAIAPVRAVDPRDPVELARLLAEKPLIATSVGTRAFPHVIRSIAAAAESVSSVLLEDLDLIAAENIHDPAGVARDVLGERVPGIHACSVGKMVPLQERGIGRLSLRAEAYNTLIVDGSDWRGAQPRDVGWIQLVDDIGAWMDRKLYIHNLGHAVCAWTARRDDPDSATIANAMDDPAIASRVREIMQLSALVVGRSYPRAFTKWELQEHVEDLIERFGNHALGDTVERVGRDVERKLGSTDRLIGAMRLGVRALAGDREQMRTTLAELADVALSALSFGVPGIAALDSDIAISQRLSTTDPATLITELGGLDPGDPVDTEIINAFRRRL